MERSQKQAETYCKFCKKYIKTQNYLIHEGRCERQQELRSSRLSNQSNQSENSQQSFWSSSKKTNQINERNSPFDKKEEKKNIFDSNRFKKQKPKQQEVQKIPCYYCGYPQTMEQLDTHPNSCLHWETQCQYCQQKFPKSLMDQHQAICSQNPMNQPFRRRNSQEQEEIQHNHIPMIFRRRQRQLYQPSSLMDIFLGNNFMRHQNFNQQQISQPSINILQISRGQNGPQRIIIRGNGSSNPANFIRLIQMLANLQNPNQNPGLNQNQLKSLKRIKYTQKNSQPQTCTICFCEFQEKQQLIQLKCNHLYHQECIFEWLKRVSTCPNCKKPVREQQYSDKNQSPQRGAFNRSSRNNIREGFF